MDSPADTGLFERFRLFSLRDLYVPVTLTLLNLVFVCLLTFALVSDYFFPW